MQRRRQNKAQSSNRDSGPFRVAVTGNAGSGKSMVCRQFERLGIPAINLDVLARKAVAPPSRTLEKITAHFGRSILNKDGFLNRRALRERIIADRASRSALERIVHPEIRRLLQKEVARHSGEATPFVVVEVPLLFESGMEKEFDAVVLVTADGPLQEKRLSRRDRVSIKDARMLLQNQIPDEKKVDGSDFVIRNTGSTQMLNAAVVQLFFVLARKYSKNH